MRRLKTALPWLVLLVCLTVFAVPVWSQWGGSGAWDSLAKFLAEEHSWSGLQSFVGGIYNPGGYLGGIGTISANTTLTASDLGKQYDVTGDYIITLPTPSTTVAGRAATEFNCRSGATLFITDTTKSINESGTSLWVVGPGAKVKIEYSGVSVFASVERGSGTRW